MGNPVFVHLRASPLQSCWEFFFGWRTSLESCLGGDLMRPGLPSHRVWPSKGAKSAAMLPVLQQHSMGIKQGSAWTVEHTRSIIYEVGQGIWQWDPWLYRQCGQYWVFVCSIMHRILIPKLWDAIRGLCPGNALWRCMVIRQSAELLALIRHVPGRNQKDCHNVWCSKLML